MRSDENIRLVYRNIKRNYKFLYQRDKRMSAMWNEKEYMRRKQKREGLSFSLNIIIIIYVR